MQFLAPLFFVGLAAVAIPVLVHLIQRERKKVVPFPSRRNNSMPSPPLNSQIT